MAKKTSGKTPPSKRTSPPANGQAARKAAPKGATSRTGFTSRGLAARDGAPEHPSPTNSDNRGNGASDHSLASEAEAATGAEGGPISMEDLKKVKTGLSRKDLDHYRGLLLEKRGEILGDVAALETGSRQDRDNLSNMPLHMADVGSENFEQEFRLGLVESERRLLDEIDQALLRVQTGIYGVCLERGIPISRARLDAKPWAKYCIEAERALEKRHR